mmetsp:Transcript_26270/g.60680  ORF Transcript_26270/g.60680 Transcript_26270/m.60680 type:complete len:412 (+) Transcript_26270:1337-2572(+)
MERMLAQHAPQPKDKVGDQYSTALSAALSVITGEILPERPQKIQASQRKAEEKRRAEQFEAEQEAMDQQAAAAQAERQRASEQLSQARLEVDHARQRSRVAEMLTAEDRQRLRDQESVMLQRLQRYRSTSVDRRRLDEREQLFCQAYLPTQTTPTCPDRAARHSIVRSTGARERMLRASERGSWSSMSVPLTSQDWGSPASPVPPPAVASSPAALYPSPSPPPLHPPVTRNTRTPRPADSITEPEAMLLARIRRELRSPQRCASLISDLLTQLARPSTRDPPADGLSAVRDFVVDLDPYQSSVLPAIPSAKRLPSHHPHPPSGPPGRGSGGRLRYSDSALPVVTAAPPKHRPVAPLWEGQQEFAWRGRSRGGTKSRRELGCDGVGSTDVGTVSLGQLEARVELDRYAGLPS